MLEKGRLPEMGEEKADGISPAGDSHIAGKSQYLSGCFALHVKAEIYQERVDMKCYLLSNIALIFTACFISITCLSSIPALSSLVHAAEVTLIWDANSEEDLAGYRLYYKSGSSGAPYDGTGLNEGDSPVTVQLEDLDNPDSPGFTLTGLENGECYFMALTAFDTEGLESYYSDEISYIEEDEEDGEGEEGGGDEEEPPDTSGDDSAESSDEETSDDPPTDTQTEENQVPAAPVPVSDNIEAVPLDSVKLAVAEFEDPDDGDAHLQTEWRIFRAEDDVCVLNVISTSFLTAFRVPAIFLDEHTEYNWRTRFFDQKKEASEWSKPATFTTGFSEKDADGNGVPDSQEVDASVDMNQDGLPDAEQEITKAISLPQSNQPIGLGIEDSETGMTILFLEALDTDALEISESSKRRAQELPYGLLNFKLAVAESGDAVTVKIYFPEPVPQNAKWMKLDFFSGLWIDCSEYIRFSEDRMSMDLELVDGGSGDEDGVANSITIDPAGLEFSVSEPAEEEGGTDGADKGDSGGGCFITGTLKGLGK